MFIYPLASEERVLDELPPWPACRGSPADLSGIAAGSEGRVPGEVVAPTHAVAQDPGGDAAWGCLVWKGRR